MYIHIYRSRKELICALQKTILTISIPQIYWSVWSTKIILTISLPHIYWSVCSTKIILTISIPHIYSSLCSTKIILIISIPQIYLSLCSTKIIFTIFILLIYLSLCALQKLYWPFSFSRFIQARCCLLLNVFGQYMCCKWILTKNNYFKDILIMMLEGTIS